MNIHHEISLRNFRAISKYANGVTNDKIRSPQDDRWLTSLGPQAYRSVYDPGVGLLATSWRELRPGLVTLYGESRPNSPLNFPVRAVEELVGLFIGTNISIGDCGVPHSNVNADAVTIFPFRLKEAVDASFEIGAGKTAFYFGIFGQLGALVSDFALVKSFVDPYGSHEALNDFILIKENYFANKILQSLIEMTRHPLQGQAADAFLLGKVFEILGLALHVVQANADQEMEVGKTSIIDFVCREIDRDPAAELSLRDFAYQLNASISTISRNFRLRTGVTFSEYQRNRRVELAAKILTSMNLSAAEVSRKVGYSAITSFYRAFKDRYGVTPDEFRRARIGFASDRLL